MSHFNRFLPAEARQVLLRLLQVTFTNLDPDHPDLPNLPNLSRLKHHINQLKKRFKTSSKPVQSQFKTCLKLVQTSSKPILLSAFLPRLVFVKRSFTCFYLFTTVGTEVHLQGCFVSLLICSHKQHSVERCTRWSYNTQELSFFIKILSNH